MSCTCNQSINCDPCVFCTPPGVTCLTTCAPIDLCQEKIDIDCVLYSGEDHTCSQITNTQPISQIMLQALSLIFPIEQCCYFEATVVLIDPPPSQYTFCYSSAINNGSCNKACSCDSTTSNVTVYSLDNPLILGSLLYTDGGLSTPVPAGWYSANGNCYVISGGATSIIPGVSGAIQSITPCVTPTTTAAPTTTLAPCYCYTVTIGGSSSTISYIDCNGANQTSQSYSANTVVTICAESITPNTTYTITNPTQYCADRITCPTTTSTTTAAPTTVAPTTIPPCNCITFTNPSDQARISWRNCLGQIKNDTIAAAPDANNGEYTIERRCGSSGAANNPKIQIVVGEPCIGFASDPFCLSNETTTVQPCSPWLLYCCGNAGDGIISIKPCYPNPTAPFAINNMYKDEQSRTWIVVGTTGIPTSTYAPSTLIYIGNSTLAECQSMSAGQLCPGITTTVAPPSARVMKFNATDCLTACTTGSSVTVYSNCPVLSLSGCRLYTNAALTTPVAAGYYVDSTTNLVFQVNSNGNLVNQYSCLTAPCAPAPTTVPPSTTFNTKTITLKNDVTLSSSLYPASVGFPIIISSGYYLNASAIFPFTTVSWYGGTFNSVPPNQSITGTYTSINTGLPIAIQISATKNTSGVAYNGLYYARILKNGSQANCVTFSPSVASQIINSGVYYTNGDTIEIRISTTSC
jgi:hypothetical protein